MHHVKLSDLSIKTLRNMKKRIQFCRDNKDNSITDTFRGLDLNFFENCVDAVIALKEQGYAFIDRDYQDILDKAVITDNDSTDRDEITVIKLPKDREKASTGQRYMISSNPDSFKSNIKYLYTETGGFCGISNLFIVDINGRLYKCKSHGAYGLENIENEVVIGEFLGELSLPITTVKEPRLEHLTVAMMDGTVRQVITIDEDLRAIICIEKEEEYYTEKPLDDFDEYDKFLDSIIRVKSDIFKR